jgi:hypothetical protein
MPVPDKKIKHFVRREQTIRAFDEFLRGDENLWIADLRGFHGIGKTTVLLHYYRSRGNIQHAWIDLRARKYRAIPYREGTTSEAIAALFDAQQGYRALLLDIAADLLGATTPAYSEFLAEIRQIMPDNLAQAEKFLSQIGRFVRKVNFKPEFSFAGLRVGVGGLELEAPFDPKKNFNEQADIRRGMKDALVRKIVAMNLKGCVLIVFDDFCQIQGTYLERWIATELLPRLQGCKVVLSHTEVDSAFLPTDTFAVPLERFSLAETRKYVEIRLGTVALELGLAERLHAHFDGNPQQIEWAVDSIQMIGVEHAGDLPFFRQTSSSGQTSTIADLAATQIDLVVRRSPEMKAAIEVACLLQEFDRKLFEAVMIEAVPDSTETSLSLLWKKLGELSFIESREDGRVCVVHPQIARSQESLLRERNAAYADEIHRVARRWYGAALQKREEDSDASVWERLHQYEQAEWQVLTQGWLRHLAASPEAGVEIAMRYFDAFFWWGEYIDFPFCERLLEELKAASLSARGRKIVEMLEEFHRNFIPQRQWHGASEWAQEVLLVLSHLTDRLGLANPSDDPERWHVRGLVENYVAEARYAADAVDSLVETSYRSSAEAFFNARQIYSELAQQAARDGDRKLSRRYRQRAETEGWHGAWVCVWLAGLYAEWNHPLEAERTAALAEQIILKVDPKDIEALGRIHAARGDLHFTARRWDDALREYQLYALFALGFLIDEYGIGGDTYTLEYLRECIEHLYARLLDLQRQAPAVLGLWWSSWLSFWGEKASLLLPASLPKDFPGDITNLLRADTGACG